MHLSKLDLLHVPWRYKESDVSRSFMLWYLCYVGHKHSISAWGFADRKVATLVLLSIKLSACRGVLGENSGPEQLVDSTSGTFFQ